MTLLQAVVSKGVSSDQHNAGATTVLVPAVTVICGFGFSQPDNVNVRLKVREITVQMRILVTM